MRVFLVVIFASLAFASNTTKPYPGYRMALSKEGLAIYHTESFNEAIDELKKTKIPDIETKTKDKGYTLRLTNIRLKSQNVNVIITDYKIPKHNQLLTKYKNHVVAMSLSFDYKYNNGWFDFTGTGTFKVDLLDTSLSQEYFYQWCTTTLMTGIKKTAIEVTGFAKIFGLLERVQALLNEHQADEIVSIFSEKLYNAMAVHYRSVTITTIDIKTTSLNVISEIINIEKTEEGIIIYNYETTASIDKKPISKKLYRQNNNLLSKHKDFKELACMPISLFISVNEIYRRTEEFEKNLNISRFDKLGALSHIIPRIDAYFDINQKMDIICGANNTNDIVILKSYKEKIYNVLIPITCIFRAASDKSVALSVDTIVNSTLELNFMAIDDVKFVLAQPIVAKNQIVYFSVGESVGKIEDFFTLQSLINDIYEQMEINNNKFLSLEIKVPIGFGKSINKGTPILNDHEVCVKYS